MSQELLVSTRRLGQHFVQQDMLHGGKLTQHCSRSQERDIERENGDTNLH